MTTPPTSRPDSHRVVRVPRDELLASVDLARLADQLLGESRGAGRAARWPCPSPGHGPQTGRTPPVTIYTTPRGIPRWRCHACGAGGTAIDLLMETHGLSVADAFRELTGHSEPNRAPSRRPVNAPAAVRATRASAWARHALDTYVTACEHHLWNDLGRGAREWLAARGLDDAVLRANRVGYDPGPRRLARAKGLPRHGPGIVFPVLDSHGPIYLQTRALDPDATGRKYDNPAAWLAPNPRHVTTRTPEPTTPDAANATAAACVFVCEGIPDALSISQTGGHAVALLGTGVADQRTAAWLHHQHPNAHLVLALDNDPRGQTATRELAGRLEDLGHHATDELALPSEINDINDWLAHDESALHDAIHAQVQSVANVDLDAAVAPPGNGV